MRKIKLKQQEHKQFLEMWKYDLCSYLYIKYIYLIHGLISLCSVIQLSLIFK
jgi:hypothetical protein